MKLLLLLAFSAAALADPALEEQRYCGPPRRNAAGEILRRSAVLAAFKRAHPCPNTGKTAGPCEWQLDHVVPLEACGCDAVSNLQWLPPAIKRGAGTLPKDRWERRVYKCPGEPAEVVATPR